MRMGVSVNGREEGENRRQSRPLLVLALLALVAAVALGVTGLVLVGRAVSQWVMDGQPTAVSERLRESVRSHSREYGDVVRIAVQASEASDDYATETPLPPEYRWMSDGGAVEVLRVGQRRYWVCFYDYLGLLGDARILLFVSDVTENTKSELVREYGDVYSVMPGWYLVYTD
jgi:hypothetical protein